MTAPDTLKPLEGEPQIPSLTARSNTGSYKPVIAGGALILSLVGVLGFAASRYIGKKDVPQEATVDVASATVTRLKFQEPAIPPPAVTARQSGPVAGPTRVPSIQSDAPDAAAAIPVRATATPAKALVPVGDESPFGSGIDGSATATATATQRGGAADVLPSGAVANDAQANMRRYQSQLSGMLAQLQSLTDKAAGGDKAAATSLAATMIPPLSAPNAAATASPALFGSMERSATPTVAAGLLANRSLTMPRGVLFTCSLKTQVISATSGFVACQVQRNVFSDDGKVVLAERGSHLDGDYRVVQVRPGMTRIPVLWTRLRTPHGVTVDLDSPATGSLGESGIGGYVDNRWPERIGAAMLVSLIDDAVKIVATDTDPSTGSTTVLLPSTTAAGSKLAERVLEATINIPPLLYQNQGNVVGVYVARDVDFSKVYALEPR